MHKRRKSSGHKGHRHHRSHASFGIGGASGASLNTTARRDRNIKPYSDLVEKVKHNLMFRPFGDRHKSKTFINENYRCGTPWCRTFGLSAGAVGTINGPSTLGSGSNQVIVPAGATFPLRLEYAITGGNSGGGTTGSTATMFDAFGYGSTVSAVCPAWDPTQLTQQKFIVNNGNSTPSNNVEGLYYMGQFFSNATVIGFNSKALVTADPQKSIPYASYPTNPAIDEMEWIVWCFTPDLNTMEDIIASKKSLDNWFRTNHRIPSIESGSRIGASPGSTIEQIYIADWGKVEIPGFHFKRFKYSDFKAKKAFVESGWISTKKWFGLKTKSEMYTQADTASVNANNNVTTVYDAQKPNVLTTNQLSNAAPPSVTLPIDCTLSFADSGGGDALTGYGSKYAMSPVTFFGIGATHPSQESFPYYAFNFEIQLEQTVEYWGARNLGQSLT